MAPILDEAAPGRATLFCCLACGMPFAFPDDAYTAKDPDVASLVAAVHATRRFLVYASSGAASSPAQWVADDAPIFPALARQVILRRAAPDSAAASGPQTIVSWPLDQVQAFHDLLRRCCQRGENAPPPHRVVLDTPLVSSSAVLCMGCAAQVDEPILAGTLGKGIPPVHQLPFATSLMHDAYTLAFAVVSCILVLVDAIAPAHRPPLAKVWRARGLVSMYVGFLLYHLSDRQAARGMTTSFETWYMFYFFDAVHLGTESKALLGRLVDLGGGDGQPKVGKSSRVAEAARLIAGIAKENWHLLAPSLVGNVMHKNPSRVMKLYVAYGIEGAARRLAPAPFCCSRRLHASHHRPAPPRRRSGATRQEAEEEDDGGGASSMVMVERSVLLHRLRVGMEGTFGMRGLPKSLLKGGGGWMMW